MKRNCIRIIAVLFAAGMFSACNGVRNQDIGLVGGGIAGGYLGSALSNKSTLGTVAGATAGAYVGRKLAK